MRISAVLLAGIATVGVLGNRAQADPAAIAPARYESIPRAWYLPPVPEAAPAPSDDSSAPATGPSAPIAVSLHATVDTVGLDQRPVPDAAPFGLSWEEAIAQAKVLVPKLTLEDKVDMVTGIGWQWTPCIGNIKPIPKIGFQGLCLQDSPTGSRFVYNTSAFSSAINLAATFDKTLMFRQGLYMGREQRAKGIQVTLAPVMNIMRAPEGGRAWESGGADPVLSGFSASLQIQGVQSSGVIATAKHYILNDQEHNRQDQGDSIVGRRAFYEVYLRPFKKCVDAGVGALMCSYNKINGTFACENPEVIRILKEELGFKGWLMSDWWGGYSGAGTANAGMDMMMPGGDVFGSYNSYWGPNLTLMVKNGTVKESRVDDMVTRILSSWIKAGQDDGTFPEVNFNSWNSTGDKRINVQGNHKQHIRAVGAASTVLVKHDGKALPFAAGKGVKTIAVIGEDAFGPQNGLNSCPDHGCIDGTVAQGWGSGTTYFPYIIAPVDAITDKAKKLNITVLSTSDEAVAAYTASKADIAVVFVFADSGENYLTVDGNAGDRNDLNVWHNGDRLVNTVAAVKPTIVVVHSPGPVVTPWSNNPNVVAIIFALFPGQETGNSLADVLFGDVNPSGRLPFTVGAKREDYPADIVVIEKKVEYKEGILVDYRWFEAKNITPVYPFGHGLSYTSFSYSALTVVPPSDVHRRFSVSVDVTNTGKVDGHEVVQLYLRLPTSTCQVEGCAKELREFERVFIKAGETKTVTLPLYEDDLAFYDVVSMGWVVAKGEYVVSVGASSADIRATATITI